MKLNFKAVVTFSFLTSFAQANDPLTQLQMQTTKAVSEASGASQAFLAADYLMGKMSLKQLHWYPASYPNSRELDPANLIAPRISLRKRDMSLSAPLVPILEIYKKKKTSCNPGGWEELSVPAVSFVDKAALASSSYCLSDAKSFSVDVSRLGSLQEAPDANTKQAAFISVFNQQKLSSAQNNQMMANPKINVGMLMGGLSTIDKQNLFDPVRVVFEKYIPHPEHPLALGAIRAQVGNLLVDIPMEIPPAPNCRIIPKTAGVIRPGDLVEFALEVDSITRDGSYVYDSASAPLQLSAQAYDLSSTIDIGTYKTIFSFKMNAIVENTALRLDTDGDGRNDSVPWPVHARLKGVTNDATLGTEPSCSVQVPVFYFPPICKLEPQNRNILKGESTQLTLNCQEGGTVTSASIAGVNVNTLPSNGDFTSKDIKNPKRAIAQVPYTRKELAKEEAVSAVVEGPLGKITVSTLLGKVCDFNDPNHQAIVIERGQWASEAKKRGSINTNNPDPLAFSSSPSTKKWSMPYNSKVRAYLNAGETLSSGKELWVNGDLTQRWKRILNSKGEQIDIKCRNGMACNTNDKCRFKATVEPSGNFEMIDQGFYVDETPAVKFSTKTGVFGNEGSFLTMQTDGNLVLFSSDGKRVLWDSKTGTSPSIGSLYKLELRGDGWMGITNASGQVVKELAATDPECDELPETRYNFNIVYGDWNPDAYDRKVAGLDQRHQACSSNGEKNICMLTWFAEKLNAPDPERVSTFSFENETYRSLPGYGTFWVAVDATDEKCALRKVAARTGGCFAKETPILMENGNYKQISEVNEGDLIFNPHFKMGVRVKKVVKGPEEKSLYEVVVGSKSIQVTEDHPFFTQRGWVQAMSLKSGDQLLGEGAGKSVSRIQKLDYRGPQEVWNMELDTNNPLAKVVIANGIPTGELSTQLELKNGLKKLH